MPPTVLQSIGRTPLVLLRGFARKRRLAGNVLAKLESANPFGSVKDRAALFMIRAAEDDGKLLPGGVIVEPTSGNTGIGLAGVGAVLGYRVILAMPETMSEERRRLLAAHGAELVLTPGGEGMAGAVRRAEEIVRETAGAFMPDQFSNPANALAHFEGTGPEIWEALSGDVACFVSGVGSGGTVTGVGRFLKGKNPGVKIVAIEPAESPVLAGGRAGPHRIQGIGAGFVPALLDRGVLDEVMAVASDDAIRAAREVAESDGLLPGISGGAALAAAARLAATPEYDGQNVVTILPDSGERYLSTGIFG